MSSACLSPVPILQSITMLFGLFLMGVCLVLFIILIYHLFLNKNCRVKENKNKPKACLLWLLSLIFSLWVFSYFFYQSYFFLYGILALMIGLNLFIGATYKMHKIKKIYFLPIIIFALLFVVIFALKYPCININTHSFLQKVAEEQREKECLAACNQRFLDSGKKNVGLQCELECYPSFPMEASGACGSGIPWY